MLSTVDIYIYDYTLDISSQKIIDTFYFRISDRDLNVLTFEFNKVMTDCFDDFVESYNVQLNEDVICEDCTANDEIVVLG